MKHRRSGTRATAAERLLRVRGLASALGLLSGAGLVWQSSQATFSATTGNGPNQMAAGSVSITNNAGSALFTATTLAPGDTGTVCLGVQYTGSVTPTAIRLYLTGAQESDNGGGYTGWAANSTAELDDHLSLLIQVSTADLSTDPAGVCTPAGYGSFTDVSAAAPGTLLKTLMATNTGYGSGLPSNWGTVTTAKWRVFKFVYTLAATAPNGAMNDGLKFTVVWEAQR